MAFNVQTPPASQLGIRSWLFAITSAITTCAVAATILFTGLFFENTSAWDHVELGIKLGQTEEVSKFYPIFERNTQQSEALYSLIAWDLDVDTRREARLFAFEIGFKKDITSPEEIAKIIAQINTFPTNKLSSESRNQLDLIKTSLDKIRMFELTIRDETAALRDYHDAIKRTINEHSLVGADLSELMSLPSAYVGTERETLLVYHEGVLKNLPVLVGLPDNIPDLATLRTTLKSAGGLVKLVSENIAEEFATKLEAIRTTSEAIVQEHTNIAAQIRESEEKNAKSEAAIVDAKRTFRNDVGIFIANLSTQLSLEEELSRH